MGYTILIVDDSMIVRKVIERAIRLTGLDIGQIHHAVHGREALELMDRETIDMVFADINMPVMSGEAMVEELNRRGRLATTPVVMVSSDRSAVRAERLMSRGVRAYLNKPFTPESIRDTMRACLECDDN